MIIDGNEDFAKYLDLEPHSEIRNAFDFRDALDEEFDNPEVYQGDLLPWQKCEGKFELTKTAVTLWSSWNGHGKSLTTGFIALDLIEQGKKVFIASLEMSPSKTLKRMVKQASGVNHPAKSFRHKFMDGINDKLFIYDRNEVVDTDEILGAATYAATELGCQHIFIDSLMMLSLNEEDKGEMKRIMRQFKEIAEKYKIHIHIIAHLRKSENEHRDPTKFDILGSVAITNIVDNVVLMKMNKAKQHARHTGQEYDDKEPDLTLMVVKQRNGEFEGKFFLYIEQGSGQILSGHGYMKKSFPNVTGSI